MLTTTSAIAHGETNSTDVAKNALNDMMAAIPDMTKKVKAAETAASYLRQAQNNPEHAATLAEFALQALTEAGL